MVQLLSTYLRSIAQDPSASLEMVRSPMLVWDGGLYRVEDSADERMTANGGGDFNPSPDDPLFIPVESPDTLPVPPSLTIGRSDTCDLVIPSPSISRLHGVIHRDPLSKRWMVSDAGSRNGTWVDGRSIGRELPAVLKGGARVRMGDVRLRFLSRSGFQEYVMQFLLGISNADTAPGI